MAVPFDKLTIDTPEQISLEFALAGIGSRFLALLIDTVIQGFLFLIASLVAGGLLISTLSNPGQGIWILAALVLAMFLIYTAYFATFEVAWNGQTPGKRYLKLRVISDDGRGITATQAIARNLMRLVDQLPVIYAVGVMSMILSKQNRRLGDFVAGTVVVYEKDAEKTRPAAADAVVSDAVPLHRVARLSPEELRLVESFLERRSALAREIRVQAGHDIAARIRRSLDVTLEGGLDDESFLEDVARSARRAATYR